MDPRENQNSNGAPRNGAHGAGLGERFDQLGNTAQQLISEARDAVTGLRGSLDIAGRMERHPFAMLAGAVGVGYVLGGGLLSGLSFRLVRLGVKVAAIPLIKNQLFNLLEKALEAKAGGEGEQPQRGIA